MKTRNEFMEMNKEEIDKYLSATPQGPVKYSDECSQCGIEIGSFSISRTKLRRKDFHLHFCNDCKLEIEIKAIESLAICKKIAEEVNLNVSKIIRELQHDMFWHFIETITNITAEKVVRKFDARYDFDNLKSKITDY